MGEIETFALILLVLAVCLMVSIILWGWQKIKGDWPLSFALLFFGAIVLDIWILKGKSIWFWISLFI
jgi:hypothetical protein